MLELAAKAGIPGQEARSWALLTLGKLYHIYGEPEKARSLFEGILTERPDYPFAIAALGELDLEQKKYDQAEKQLKRAVEIIPEVGFYEALAQLYRKSKR
jgi:tetratricopeptide (TPR) repeat protein